MIAAVSALVVALAAAAEHGEKAGGLPQLNPADFVVLETPAAAQSLRMSGDDVAPSLAAHGS